VREFSVRQGSGGAGRQRGGDGVIRKLEFRAEMSAAILSNHRSVAPFGLAGGLDAATGSNRIERHDGTIEQLGATAAAVLHEGDVIVIETPGGGGYGEPTETT
jgi:5-oxoprolinase (ATP-hydrolysing)